jgi:SOS-response transcriptional repressor LexA
MSRMIRAEAQWPAVAFFASFDAMKPAEIRARLASTGRTQTALGRAIGKSKDSVSRLLSGQRSMDVDELAAIQAFFGDDRPAAPEFMRVPVFGYAAMGSPDRVMLASDQVLDYIELPSGLVRPNAFGVRLAGESMFPRLMSGETVIAEPQVPLVRNKEVVVQLKDDTALVKEYRQQKDGYLFLWQYNPEEEVRIPLTQVRAMHYAWRWR